jgi:hypothetical protein
MAIIMISPIRISVFWFALLSATVAPAQERFSFFQASSPESVERMLKLANLRDDDVVVDLGSGDGLIVLTAAKMNAKVRGWGVDIDEKLVAESNGVAKAEGVADRVKFFHQNAFDADLREATVVTMWPYPELMRLLRPTLLERARPGTRILTSTWDLGTWPADAVDNGNPSIYLWTVPARIVGNWSWEFTLAGQPIAYAAVLEQQFQAAEGVVRAGTNREVLSDMKLIGERIEGTAQIVLPEGSRLELPWRASRKTSSEYFAPTGVDMP